MIALLVFLFSVSAASADATSSLDSLVSEGLSLNHHHLSTRSTDSTIPLHLHHLSSTPGNRFLSRAALSSRLFRRRLDLQYDTSLDKDTTHGKVIGASLAVYLRSSVTPGTTLIIKLGEDSITEHTLTEPTSVLLIPLPEAPTSNTLLNITLTATRSTFYKDGAIATTSLPLNQVDYVEVNWNGSLEPLFFPQQPEATIRRKVKDELLWGLKRGSKTDKRKDLLLWGEAVVKGMRTLSDICVSKVVKGVVDNDWLWDWFVLIFASAIQIWLLVDLEDYEDRDTQTCGFGHLTGLHYIGESPGGVSDTQQVVN
eukprot:sb/3467076/